MLNVFIKQHEVYSKPLEYILSVLAKNKSVRLTLMPDRTNARLIFDHTDPSSLPIHVPFYHSLLDERKFHHEAYFRNAPQLLFPDSSLPDWLGTAFYMINAFQEYDASLNYIALDRYQRFPYDKSYQYKFSCIEDNLVQRCFDSFCDEHLPQLIHRTPKRKSQVFISHDIDEIHSPFIPNGLWAIKKGRLDIVLKLVLSEILLTPHLKSIDRIVKLHSEHDLKSTFFWLATNKIAANGIRNADYTHEQLARLSKFSISNGLHKSCYTTTFDEELKMLPFQTTLNRYHFLKFNLPDAWDDIAKTSVTLDSSLGYAERYGFRNSYGLPFRPYNITSHEAYRFVEVPLHVMDATLHHYMKTPIENIARDIINFIEKNSDNAILSILWHNMYLSDYKYSGYFREYKKILLYLTEAGIKSIAPEEIINEFATDNADKA